MRSYMFRVKTALTQNADLAQTFAWYHVYALKIFSK